MRLLPETRAARASLAMLVAITVHMLCAAVAFAETRPRFTFRPNRLEKTDFFLVTESSLSVTGTGSQDPMDDLLVTNSLGLMTNIDRSRALGIAIDAHIARGLRFSPTVRFKQWLGERSSVDLMVGYAHAPFDDEGVVGWNGEVRYYPVPWFHARAGVVRLRDVHAVTYFPDPHVDQTTESRIHAGVGVGEVPGVVVWGGQLLVLAALVALFAGMS